MAEPPVLFSDLLKTEKSRMKIITKLIMAGVIACFIALACPAEARYHGGYHGRGHYYGGGHYWHGRYYGPGYYGPDVFVGAPFFFPGFGVYDGPYYGGGYGYGYGYGYGRGRYYGHGHGYYGGGHSHGHGGRHR